MGWCQNCLLVLGYLGIYSDRAFLFSISFYRRRLGYLHIYMFLFLIFLISLICFFPLDEHDITVHCAITGICVSRDDKERRTDLGDRDMVFCLHERSAVDISKGSSYFLLRFCYAYEVLGSLFSWDKPSFG